MSKWISVDERLPESGEFVLIYDKNEGQHIAWLDNTYRNKFTVGFGGNEEEYYHIYDFFQVTHWMPLADDPV